MNYKAIVAVLLLTVPCFAEPKEAKESKEAKGSKAQESAVATSQPAKSDTIAVSQSWKADAGTFVKNKWSEDKPLVKEPVRTPGKKAFRLATGMPGSTSLRFSFKENAKKPTDLSDYKVLRFWAKSDDPEAVVTVQFKSADAATGKDAGYWQRVTLDETDWHQYTVNLGEMEMFEKPGWDKIFSMQFEANRPDDYKATKDAVIITEVELAKE